MDKSKFFRSNTLIAACLVATLSFAVQAAPSQGEMPNTAGCAMPPPSFAIGHRGVDQEMDHPMQLFFLHDVELTEAQRDKIFMIQHDQEPAVRIKSRTIRVAQDKLQALTWSAQYTDAKARVLVETASAEMKELALLRAHADQMIYALLTPDQREQVNQMLSDQGGASAGEMQRQHPGMPGSHPEVRTR